MHYKIKPENIHKALELLVSKGLVEIEETNIPDKAPITPDELVQEWNTRVKNTEFSICKSLGVGSHLSKFIQSCNHIKTREEWVEIIILTLKGNYEFSSWRPTLLWLVDYDNAIKVLNGDFHDHKKDSEEEFWQKLKEQHDLD